MAGGITKAKRAKIVALAQLYVRMRRGLWDWGDGCSHNDSNGNPVVNKRVLLQSVWPGCSEGAVAKYYSIFEWPPSEGNEEAVVFWGEVNLEEARFESGVKATLAQMVPTASGLANGMLAELALRFQAMPSAFSTDQLLRYTPLWIKFAAETEGAAAARDQHNPLTILIELKQSDALPPGVLEQVLSERPEVIDVLPAEAKVLLGLPEGEG